MTTNYTRNMTQTATYWTPGTNDGAGGKSYAAPVTIRCRWQDVQKLFIDMHGETVMSSAIVYPDRVLENSGYLALGDLTDEEHYMQPNLIRAAREIRSVGASPSLNGAQQLNKVYL